MSQSLRITIGQYSDKGRKDINQDFYGVYSPDDHLLDSKGIAIAVNQTVISKSEWSKTQLKENDNIAIIKATQGG